MKIRRVLLGGFLAAAMATPLMLGAGAAHARYDAPTEEGPCPKGYTFSRGPWGQPQCELR
jgi:hypothetical protein